MIDFHYGHKKYDCLYIDPPWSYANKRTGGNMTSGADAEYPTMSIKDIISIPIWKISEDNSVLFMWAVTPLLPEAFQVMKNWGYQENTQGSPTRCMKLLSQYDSKANLRCSQEKRDKVGMCSETKYLKVLK